MRECRVFVHEKPAQASSRLLSPPLRTANNQAISLAIPPKDRSRLAPGLLGPRGNL